MKNAKTMSVLPELPFGFTRVLGSRPLMGSEIDGWPDTLGSFIQAFGMPEFEMDSKSIIVFWNFFNDKPGAPFCFTCYAKVPAHVSLTPSHEIEVSICGGSAAREFADWFIGHHLAIENRQTFPPFLLSKSFQIQPTWAPRRICNEQREKHPQHDRRSSSIVRTSPRPEASHQ